jgi:hypothetical protein
MAIRNIPEGPGPAATPTKAGTVYALTDAESNTAIGYGALESNDGGINNTAIGVSSLSSNEYSESNTAIGHLAGANLIGGSNNTLLGYDAQPSDTFAYNEITLGNGDVERLRVPALGVNLTQDNVMIGAYSLTSATDNAMQNVVIGASAATALTNGASNLIVGYAAAYSETTGEWNTFLGTESGSNATTGNNNIAIGNESELSSATVSNEITLGNSEIARFRVPGIGIDWTSPPSPVGNIEIFNASNRTPGTIYGWTVPAGVTRIKATLIGPGGTYGPMSIAMCYPSLCASASTADDDSTQSTYIVADVNATRALPGATGEVFSTSYSESLSVGAYNTGGGGGSGSSSGQPERYTSTRPGAGSGAQVITFSISTSTSFSQEVGTTNRISFDWSRSFSQIYKGYPGQDGEEKVVYLDVTPGNTIGYRVGAPYAYNSGRPGQVMIEY